ncbi:MAG: DUF1304 domain-containing protein [Myxococcota bacterium]
MNTLVLVLVLVVAALHAFFFVLEAILWTKPYGRKVFRTTEAFAKESAVLAMNQGLYNLFLTAGLVWGVIAGHGVMVGNPVIVFFLACVIVAGIVGGLTSNPRIFLIQGVPAIVALALVLLVG